MKVLLDTHAFFWWATKHHRLSRRALETIETRANDVYVSAVTAWELAFKSQLGKWAAGGPVAEGIDRTVEANGFQPLPIQIAHARRAGFLQSAHRDPFDRILAAQAQLEEAAMVTADPIFRQLDIRVIW